MIKNYNHIFISSLLYLSLATPQLLADESDNLVKSIMKLRSDVESLYTKVDDNKDMYKSQMKSFAMQKADADAQISRKETELKQFDSEMDKLRTKIAESSYKNEDIKPILFKAIDDLKVQIKGGIPFKVDARVAELEKVKIRLNDKVITPEKALLLVWSAYDDALRITKENGLFKQQITINGKEKLCQVAKLGSIMLFFATPDDNVGYAQKTAQGYEYKVVHDKEQKKKIVVLFDALQKQIRTGYFSIPNALLNMENR